MVDLSFGSRCDGGVCRLWRDTQASGLFAYRFATTRIRGVRHVGLAIYVRAEQPFGNRMEEGSAGRDMVYDSVSKIQGLRFYDV